jgi:hypothetical protein
MKYGYVGAGVQEDLRKPDIEKDMNTKVHEVKGHQLNLTHPSLPMTF